MKTTSTFITVYSCVDSKKSIVSHISKNLNVETYFSSILICISLLATCMFVNCTGDIVSLLQFTECVASKIPNKWRRVGVALGLSQALIEAIDDHHRGEPFKCFFDVFKYWQNESTSERPANWATLISVLQSNTVGEEALAKDIQRTFIRDTH